MFQGLEGSCFLVKGLMLFVALLASFLFLPSVFATTNCPPCGIPGVTNSPCGFATNATTIIKQIRFEGCLAAKANNSLPAVDVVPGGSSTGTVYQESKPDSAQFDIDRNPTNSFNPNQEDTDFNGNGIYDINADPSRVRIVCRMGQRVFPDPRIDLFDLGDPITPPTNALYASTLVSVTAGITNIATLSTPTITLIAPLETSSNQVADAFHFADGIQTLYPIRPQLATIFWKNQDTNEPDIVQFVAANWPPPADRQRHVGSVAVDLTEAAGLSFFDIRHRSGTDSTAANNQFFATQSGLSLLHFAVGPTPNTINQLSKFITVETKAFRQDDAYLAAVLGDQPLAYWRLDESSAVADNRGSLGPAADGDYDVGVTRGQPGLLGNDSNPAVSVTAGAAMETGFFDKFPPDADGISLEAWIRLVEAPAEGSASLVGDGEGSTNYFFMLYLINNMGTLDLQPFLQTDAGVLNPTTLDGAIEVGRTYHVVSTWATSGVLRLFLNGVQMSMTGATTLAGSPLSGEKNNAFFIGRDNRASAAPALLDEVAIYSYPLSPAQVQAHFEAGAHQLRDIGKTITDPIGAYNDGQVRNGLVFYTNAFYDTEAYDRDTRVGPILPVNEDDPLSEEDGMVVAWYDVGEFGISWPVRTVRYELHWPADDVVSKVYVASQMGSGGLDAEIFPQPQIYVQSDPALPGYNPNEEHAALFDQGGNPAVFALRNDLNDFLGASQPYVLLKYMDPFSANQNDTWLMKVFKVFPEGGGHDFNYPITAGQPIMPPFPLSILPQPTNSVLYSGEKWYLRDHKEGHWAKAGASTGETAEIVMQWYYPLQADWFFPDFDTNGVPDAQIGDPIALLNGGQNAEDPPTNVIYTASWPATSAILSPGETLTHPKKGLPDVFAMASAEVIFDENLANDLTNNPFSPDSSHFLSLRFFKSTPGKMDVPGSSQAGIFLL